MSSLKGIENELADLLKALGHPDRVRLVEYLRDEEKDVQTLSESLGVRQARVSQHLAVLRAGHIVEDRREGRHVLYRLAKPALAAWIILGGMTLMEGRVSGAQDFAGENARAVLAEVAIEEEEKKKKKRSKP